MCVRCGHSTKPIEEHENQDNNIARSLNYCKFESCKSQHLLTSTASGDNYYTKDTIST